jgi:SRSO17 transposase
VGAEPPRAQRLQWFLWESDWDEREVQAERLRLLREDPATTPTAQGVLVIDETGVSLDGHQTAHVSRQYLAKLGKIDNGVVSVSSLWADEGIYYPLDVEPYTPAVYFAKGKHAARRGARGWPRRVPSSQAGGDGSREPYALAARRTGGL